VDHPPAVEEIAPNSARSTTVFADYVALAKPGITIFNVLTALGGLWLAHERGGVGASKVPVSGGTVLATLVGTTLIVAGANTLNQYIERNIDGLMSRTKDRPLPTGRVTARAALIYGIALSALAVPVFAMGTNGLTTALAVFANLAYVLAYTPMKQRSHHSLLVGAVPGAMPPLLGWAAALGMNALHPGASLGGLVLFATMFLWQVPHFLAITLFRKDDYARAGLIVMPNVRDEREVKHTIVRYTFALVATSMLLYPLGVSGLFYAGAALALGVVFFVWGLVGLRSEDVGIPWAKSLFGVSLLYLLALFGAIAIDAVL
jgi:protoheme IX farnesyltransferase